MLAHDIVYGYRKVVCHDIESLNAERNLTGLIAHENGRTNALICQLVQAKLTLNILFLKIEFFEIICFSVSVLKP
jgi:hypothetical protein